MKVFIKGKEIQTKPSKSIGKGGEADIFDIGQGMTLKLFKSERHPDIITPEEKKAARARIAIHQKKLPAFPKNLPKKVVSPVDMGLNSSGKIIGYTMPFIQGAETLRSLSDVRFRLQSGYSGENVVRVFRDIRDVVAELHKKNVVVGDFNDLNILVVGEEPWFIDADSYQYGGFLCAVFTEKFVDPIFCDPKGTAPVLIKPYASTSDWYAFNVIFMQSLLMLSGGPYGGVYKPKNKSKKIPHTQRPLKRITVFDSEVKYPKPSTHYEVLPDELLDYFQKVFHKDLREAFPVDLLDQITWTTCSNCGAEHARGVCPSCQQKAPAAFKTKVEVRGAVTCTTLFRTNGVILYSTVQNGGLKYVYTENDAFWREGGSKIAVGNVSKDMRFRVCGRKTLMGRKGRIFSFSPSDSKPEQIIVDTFRGNLPVFDANSTSRFWLSGGTLLRENKLGLEYTPDTIGNVLDGQTLFWVGDHQGFGFYNAGDLNISFVFETGSKAINDQVEVSRFSGQLLDATCFFSKNIIWFLRTVQEQGKTRNECVVIDPSGKVMGTEESRFGSDSWLGKIRGKCAFGNGLFSSTDEGVVKVELDNGLIHETASFPDTEKFVDSEMSLHMAKNGIFCVGNREVKLLEIK